MKILTITDLFDPSIGGMELHVLEVARERHRLGIDVTIATLTPDSLEATSPRSDGLKVVRMNNVLPRPHRLWQDPARPFHPPFPIPAIARRLRKIVDAVAPDAVHAHNWIVYSYLSIKKPSDPPVFWMQHDYSLSCAKKSGWYFRDQLTCSGPAIAKCVACASSHYGVVKGTAVSLGLRSSNFALIRRVDRMAANSTAVRDFIRPMVPRKLDIPVISGFFDKSFADRVASVERPSYLPPTDNFILFVGSTGRYKGIYDLLAAYGLLHDAPPLVVLQVPRHDSPTDWPPGVTVRDGVPYQEVLAAMRHCAFLVVPSRWPEPFGRVVLEAASFGKMVLATNVGGLADLVGDDGVLVPPNNPSMMAAAMTTLIHDPDRVANLGDRARAKVSLYTVEKTTQRLNAEISEMLDSHASGRT
jgi:glycosyltransferase involved in cell wall biosynthesis